MKQYGHMDKFTQENSGKTNPAEVKAQKINSNWLRTLSLGLGVIGIGLAIGIGGYFLGTNKIQIPPVITQVSPTPTPDPTADWKTYKNIKLNISIKYPSELFVKEFGSAIVFTFEPYPPGEGSRPSDLIEIAIKGNYIGSTFDALFKANKGDDVVEAHHAIDVKVEKLNNFRVGDYDAVEYIRDGITLPITLGRGPIGYEHHVLIKKSDQEFIDLINQGFDVKKNKQHDSIFNGMVSTFKFTGQDQTTDTSDWTTHKNTKYDIEIRFPADQRVIGAATGTGFASSDLVFSVTNNTTTQAPESYTGVYIYAKASPDDLTKCPINPAGKKITETKDINGTAFFAYAENVGDSAMGGSRHLVSEYQAIHNNICYRLVSHVLYRSIGYIRESIGLKATAQEVQQEQDWIKTQQQLNNQVLSTFKFTN